AACPFEEPLQWRLRERIALVAAADIRMRADEPALLDSVGPRRRKRCHGVVRAALLTSPFSAGKPSEFLRRVGPDVGDKRGVPEVAAVLVDGQRMTAMANECGRTHVVMERDPTLHT